jgi:hypothetical protein
VLLEPSRISFSPDIVAAAPTTTAMALYQINSFINSKMGAVNALDKGSATLRHLDVEFEKHFPWDHEFA